MVCDDNNIVLNDEELPTITIAIFIEKATPFLEEFFDNVLTIDYPKKQINVFLHNAVRTTTIYYYYSLNVMLFNYFLHRLSSMRML